MPAFHCPLGAVYYDDEPCIDCGLCQASTPRDLVEASRRMREYLRAQGARKNGRRKIAVCGKGGTGKSTLTALLAGALRLEGHTVLVIDSDESNPGLPRLLGLDTAAAPLISLLERFSLGDRKPDASWLEADRISLESIPRAFIVSAPRMKFLTVGKIIDPFQGCACQMADLARDFVRKIDLGTKELMLIDMEAGVESFGRGMERGVDTVLTIVEPSFDSLELAEKIRYMAEGLGIMAVQAISNKVPSHEVEEKVREQLENKGIKMAGAVSLDPQISEAGFSGKKLPDNTQAGAQVRKIAAALFTE